MDRDYRFRGKRSDTGKWVYGDLITWWRGEGSRAICDVGGIRHDVDPATVGQYIGKRDKHGKEVYSDHILRYTETVFTDCSQTEIAEVLEPALMRIVTYRPLASVIMPISKNVRAFGIDQETGERIILGDIRSEDIEIVGSIHDNPELLEGGPPDDIFL